MSDRYIDVKKEQLLIETVEKELKLLKDKKVIDDPKNLSSGDLRIIEAKLSDVVSKALSEHEMQKPWFCHLERHKALLKPWEKASEFHTNRKRLNES